MQTQLENFTDLYQEALLKHKNASGNGVNAVLDLCTVLRAAKENLSRVDWQYFIRKQDFTGSKNAEARLKTMLAIGKTAAELRKHANKLPAALTSLKFIAKMSPARLEAAVAQKLVTSLSTTEDVKLVAFSTRRQLDPKSTKPKAGPGMYSVTLKWFPAEWTPARGRSVRGTLESFLRQHAQELGLQPDVTWSLDAELSLMADEREKVA